MQDKSEARKDWTHIHRYLISWSDWKH